MLPALAVAGFGAGFALEAYRFLYGVYLEDEIKKENERYWSDYEKNTGVKPLYPHRAGSYQNDIGTFLDVSEGVVNLYRKGKR